MEKQTKTLIKMNKNYLCMLCVTQALLRNSQSLAIQSLAKFKIRANKKVTVGDQEQVALAPRASASQALEGPLGAWLSVQLIKVSGPNFVGRKPLGSGREMLCNCAEEATRNNNGSLSSHAAETTKQT